MKPSEIFKTSLKQYFSQCIDENIDLTDNVITFFCDVYKIIIEKNGLGFNLSIYDNDDNSRYISLLNSITAYSMSKKLGLETVYDNQFRDLKDNLDKIIYEDKIKNLFQNNLIDEINQEYRNNSNDRERLYTIKKYAKKYNYLYDYENKMFKKFSTEDH